MLTTLTVQQQARLVHDTCGQAVCAFAIGIQTPKLVREWAEGRAEPEAQQTERLAALARVVELLQTRYGSNDNIVRAWLMSPSFANDASAIEIIREGDPLAAVRSAQSYVA